MKKYLNSPEQLLIALKLQKVVYVEGTNVSYKMVENHICSFDESGCIFINQSIYWRANKFYVLMKELEKKVMGIGND